MRIEDNGSWHRCQPMQGWADQREQMRRHHLASLLVHEQAIEGMRYERRRRWTWAALCVLAASVIALALVMP